jgi:hypothetical protein
LLLDAGDGVTAIAHMSVTATPEDLVALNDIARAGGRLLAEMRPEYDPWIDDEK